MGRGPDGRGGRDGDGARRVDVVLVEDAPPEAPDPVTADGAARRADRPRPGPRRRWWWTAAAALAGVVVADVVGDRDERVDPSAHADVRGLVASLRDPLRELWRLPATDGVWTAGDAVITTDADRVRAFDADTGAARWSAALPDEMTTPPQCPYTAGEGRDRSAVVCFLHTGAGTHDDPRVARFGVVGTPQGTLLRQLSVPGLVGSAQVGEDLVVMALRGSGVTVSRHDLISGDEVWRTDLPGVIPGADGLAFSATDDVVWAVGRTTVVLDAGDGAELGRLVSGADPVASWSVRVVPRSGEGFGLWAQPARGRWFASDGTPGPELDGQPVEPAVQDAGPAGPLLLLSADGERLRAVDTATGEQRWERPAPDRVLLRLDGRLVATAGGRLTAVDAATGRELWSVRLERGDQPQRGPALTDGQRVAVRGIDPEGGIRLTTYALDTGVRLWQTALPDGAQGVQVLGDRLVALVAEPDGDPVLTVLG